MLNAAASSTSTVRQLPRTRVRVTDVTQTSFVASWLRTRGATRYDVKLTPEAGAIAHDVGETSATCSGLTPATAYTIHVRSCAGDVFSPWSVATTRTSDFNLQPLLKDQTRLVPISQDLCSDSELQVCNKCHFYGCIDDDTPTKYRFGTFCAGHVMNAFTATLQLLGTTGHWQTDGWGQLRDTYLHVKVEDGPWLDANALYVLHAARVISDGWPCAKTTTDHRTRRITFGGSLMSGMISVRIGLSGGNRRLAGIQLLS